LEKFLIEAEEFFGVELLEDCCGVGEEPERRPRGVDERVLATIVENFYLEMKK